MEIAAAKSHDISEWQHRIAELNALNEEVLSTKSNVVVDKYSDESAGNVTRRPHRRRGDPRRRTVCSSVRVFEVDVGYRYGDLDCGSIHIS